MSDEHADHADHADRSSADVVPDSSAGAGAGDGIPVVPDLDLDRVEADLDGVERALRRLDDGSYWTDEVTGEPIPDHVLAADPTARRSR